MSQPGRPDPGSTGATGDPPTPTPDRARPPGRLIAVEGIDQSGKQTQVERLAARLRAAGLPVRSLAFPAYETPVGRLLRDYLTGSPAASEPGPELRQLLFVANRWEIEPAIRAALAAGETVIVDRYTGSGCAYGRAQGLDAAWVDALERGLPEPDLVALLDLPPAEAFARKRAGRDRYEAQVELLERSRAAYLRLAADRGWLVLDATASIDAIAERLGAAVLALLRDSGKSAP